MRCELKEVTSDNFHDVIELEVDEEQRRYVSSNLYSIAESKFYPEYQPRAIYYDGEVVGFLMFEKRDLCGSLGEYNIFRFMLDRHHQGKGIGRKAMELALAEIKANGAVEKISICYVPTNPIARDFYGSFGFVEVGFDEATGEIIAEIRE